MRDVRYIARCRLRKDQVFPHASALLDTTKAGNMGRITLEQLMADFMAFLTTC